MVGKVLAGEGHRLPDVKGRGAHSSRGTQGAAHYEGVTLKLTMSNDKDEMR